MARRPASSDSDSEPSDQNDEEGWENAEPDIEPTSVVSLFDNHVFPDIKQMMEHCKSRHNFDFVGVQKKLGLTFLSSVKLVNYIRSEVKSGIKHPDVSDVTKFADDRYLQPVMEDDAVLFSLDELSQDDRKAEEPQSYQQRSEARLQERLGELESQFAMYREYVSRILGERWGENNGLESEMGGAFGRATNAQSRRRIDAAYFGSYSSSEIHETMLKDTVRTDSYRDFVYDNKHIFAGKTVLDVGCGTGILSMFCAKAGAARVIAVDNNEMVDKAVLNYHANGFSDIITCLRGKIEEVTLPVDKVDVIVSEWMGYCLLFEAMVDSVTWARDRYLKTDGLMVPSHCTAHIVPFADEEYIADSIDFWRDVYGFDMTAMMDGIRDDVRVRSLTIDKIVGRSSCFLRLPLHTITTGELDFVKDFSVEVTRDADALDGWCIWFDAFFLPTRDAVLPEDARAETWTGPGNAFTTGPGGKPTHWESSLLLVERTGRDTGLKAGQRITGSVAYKKGPKNPRDLAIEMEWRIHDGAGEKRRQAWKLEGVN